MTISGGSQKVRYFASLGVFTQDGLFNCYQKDYDDNYSYNRYNYRLNLDIDLTKTTQFRMNMGGRVNDKHTPGVDGESGLSNIETIFRGIYWLPHSPVQVSWTVNGCGRMHVIFPALSVICAMPCTLIMDTDTT